MATPKSRKRPAQHEPLGDIPLFSELSVADLRSIRRLMTPARIRKGKQLTVQGQIGREFIIILEGEASVMVDGRKVASVSQGDFLGEYALLSGEPRTATVVADTDMSVEVLTRHELLSLLDAKPVVAKKMLSGVVKRYRELRSSIRGITSA